MPRPGEANKGYEAAVTALEMADLLRQLPAPAPAAGPTERARGDSTCCDWSCPRDRSKRRPCELFAAADLAVVRGSDVDYRATIDDPRVDEVRILRPQEIPGYVADGLLRPGDHRPRLDRGDRRRGGLARASWPTRRPRPTPSASCWPWPRTPP